MGIPAVDLTALPLLSAVAFAKATRRPPFALFAPFAPMRPYSRSHVPTFPRSHGTLHVLTFLRSYVLTRDRPLAAARSYFLTFLRSHVRFFPCFATPYLVQQPPLLRAAGNPGRTQHYAGGEDNGVCMSGIPHGRLALSVTSTLGDCMKTQKYRLCALGLVLALSAIAFGEQPTKKDQPRLDSTAMAAIDSSDSAHQTRASGATEENGIAKREDEMLTAIRSAMMAKGYFGKIRYYTFGVLAARERWYFHLFCFDGGEATMVYNGWVELRDYSVILNKVPEQSTSLDSTAPEQSAFNPKLPPERPDIEGPGPNYERATVAIGQALIARRTVERPEQCAHVWLDACGAGWQLPFYILFRGPNDRLSSGRGYITRANLDVRIDPRISD